MKWIGYRIFADGHKESLTPGGHRVFGDAARRWLLVRERLLRQTYEISKYAPVVPVGNITANFSWGEFACHDGTQVPPALRANAVRLALALEKLRAVLGGHPLPLLSVYRTVAYNRTVHGAVNSQHLYACAADLDVQAIERETGKSHDEILRCCEVINDFHGIGIYPDGAIHVDVRAGGRVFWNNWNRQ